MISLESQGVYALCHEGGEPSLYPSLVRLPLEFNTSSLGLPNPRDMWTPWSRVSPEEGEQDGCVAGALDGWGEAVRARAASQEKGGWAGGS